MADAVEHGPSFALVHLNKPIDVALAAQVALATDSEMVMVGADAVTPDHPKVSAKMLSWNIDPVAIDTLRSSSSPSLAELRAAHTGRLVATVVSGGENPFKFDWRPDDIIVIGGANGLSQADVALTDEQVTIPMPKGMEFLTVSTVIAALAFHIINRR